MAYPDQFEAMPVALDGRRLTLTAERAIRIRATGRILTEWGTLTMDQLEDMIQSNPSTRGSYELVVRYVSAWVVDQ